jgi:putative phosphoribosyl transferase
MSGMAFHDRPAAGRRLAHRLEHLRGCRVVVLALARGGAPVAFEVARALSVPMDIVVAQRIEDPFMSGLTVGAVAEGGVAVTDGPALRLAGIAAEDLAEIARGVQADVDRRARRMRAGRAPVALAGRTALLVDDGVATGATARAACRAVRARGPERLVLAVPVASADAMVGLEDEAEEIVCIDRPGWLAGLSPWYDEFPVTTDAEVAAILRHAAIRSPYRERRLELGKGPTAA